MAANSTKDTLAAHLTVCNTCRYDDLRNYSNDRSVVLAELRDVIEQPWQAWELAQADTDRYRSMSPDQV